MDRVRLNLRLRRILLALAVACAGGAWGATAIGPAALRAHRLTIAPQLASNAFGRPLLIQSEEAPNRIDGDAYAVLAHPFGTVTAVLADPARWCDVLILHLNTKYCRRMEEAGRTRIELRVGKKEEQPVNAASLLDFAWRAPVLRDDYFQLEMVAPDGPYDTRDYRLLVEAVPLDATHTFLHMGYSFGYGGASHFAMHLYLATVGRSKVGFTQVEDKPGRRDYVGGMRGVVERNTMRYYLAIDAYLSSLAAPPGQQLERRLAEWFDATERYPRQLHEVDREAYVRMKRIEVARQGAS